MRLRFAPTPTGSAGARLDRDAVRALTARVRERTGLKASRCSIPSVDAAVPAIERGARLRRSGLSPIPSALDRAQAFRAARAAHPQAL